MYHQIPQNVPSTSVVDEQEVVDSFLSSRRAKYTRLGYERDIRQVLGDPAAFIKIARADTMKEKMMLIKWIGEKKEELDGSSIRAYFTGVKSLCDFAEVYMPWKN